ncbi:MAG: alpha/beta fold hydrolase [Deltaproteobacteria bacterium]|nr:alpha/beta fold hydrolase [Deltaproteobacteria bacterium]
MNRFAYRTTGLLIKTLYNLTKARVTLHGSENIPDGSIIFAINHFTRLETFLMPYIIFNITKIPVWSLADYKLFKGLFGDYLEQVGAVSTQNPDRDQLIVKSLMTGEAIWVIFPEGRMVKSKKIVEKGRFMISYAEGKHPPHSGAATLGLRTEFYRRRILHLAETGNPEATRLLTQFNIESVEQIRKRKTYIVPVNLTYYPIRANENLLSKLAISLVENISDRVVEEIMTEGAMLLSGVDIDVRFGKPMLIGAHLENKKIQKDICGAVPFGFDDSLPSIKQMRRAALRIMNRYMATIYALTTVNHDHLFASFLRMVPGRAVDEQDLRRRVFLAASQYIGKTPMHFHKNLQQDQVSILSDDRYQKYEDFLAVATEKSVVKREGGRLIKNRSKLYSPLNFHRARIDNPIAVMANAVEPLSQLQRILRRLSWMPGFWIRRRVWKLLIEREQQRFAQDYDQHYREGESKGKEIGSPYLLTGKSRHTGIVLIHGYMAAPAEMRELATYLARKGFRVYVTRLSGHGTSPDDLAGRTYHDWIKSVDTGFGIISSQCRHVVVGGFSAGGLLALNMASRIPRLSAVFAICPSMRLQNPFSKLAPAVDTFNRMMKKVQMGRIQKTFVENKPEHPHINYSRNPISGVLQLENLIQATFPKLPDIQMPALIIQSKGDPVVDPNGSREAFEELGTSEKEYRLLNYARHGIVLGDDAEPVHRAVGDFISNLKHKPTSP